ncbi:MAG: endonuclease [Sedimenticolaceae bacterium]
MTDSINIDGRRYPAFDAAWGGFAEELFHYTSRYYCATESFVRHLADDEAFSMSGYKAAQLSEAQRDLMAAVLSCTPDRPAGQAVVSVVSAVIRKEDGVEPVWAERFLHRLSQVPKEDMADHQYHVPAVPETDVAPLDPFLSIAERLQMPVAVCDRHVEVSMKHLAQHLSSVNVALRTNLHNAIIDLHNAGYVLRNHPHLTHSEAHNIADGDAV